MSLSTVFRVFYRSSSRFQQFNKLRRVVKFDKFSIQNAQRCNRVSTCRCKFGSNFLWFWSRLESKCLKAFRYVFFINKLLNKVQEMGYMCLLGSCFIIKFIKMCMSMTRDLYCRYSDNKNVYTPFYIPPSPFHTTDQTSMGRFQCRRGEEVHIFYYSPVYWYIHVCKFLDACRHSLWNGMDIYPNFKIVNIVAQCMAL